MPATDENTTKSRERVAEPTGGGERMGDDKRDLSNCRGRVLKNEETQIK